MTYRISYTSEARQHVAEIVQWWQQNRPDAPRLVTTGLAQAERLLEHSPLAGQHHRRTRFRGIRRMRVWKTPYLVYYSVNEDEQEVIIHAVWSGARRRGPTLS